jgi:peptidoglycan/LPS O-acetylase OafA/YrhL
VRLRPDEPNAEYARTHLRLDALAFGVLLSYLYYYKDLAVRLRRVPTAALIRGGLALLSVAFVFHVTETAWVLVGGLTVCYLGAGCLLLAALRTGTTDGPLRSLAALGTYSYSIYLWHYPMALWGMSAVGKRLPFLADELYLPTYIGGSLALGIAMGWLVEVPMLRLRDRLFPSKSQTAAPKMAAEAV